MVDRCSLSLSVDGYGIAVMGLMYRESVKNFQRLLKKEAKNKRTTVLNLNAKKNTRWKFSNKTAGRSKLKNIYVLNLCEWTTEKFVACKNIREYRIPCTVE